MTKVRTAEVGRRGGKESFRPPTRVNDDVVRQERKAKNALILERDG